MGLDYKGLAPPALIPQNATMARNFNNMFYEKGASINRMFYLYLGANNFNKALTYHLREHKWTNPNVYDLMKSFAAVGLDVGSRFLPWILQPCLPVVQLSLDYHTDTLHVLQRPMSKYASADSLQWWINVPVRANDHHFTLDFNTSTTVYQLPDKTPGNKWSIEANYEYTSYMLVSYAQEDQWDHIIEKHSLPSASALWRQELVRQVFMLAQMSHERITIPTKLTRASSNLIPYFLREKDFSSALSLTKMLTDQWAPLATVLFDSHRFGEARVVLADHLLGPIMDHLGWLDTSSSSESSLKQLASLGAVYYGNERARSTATQLFSQRVSPRPFQMNMKL